MSSKFLQWFINWLNGVSAADWKVALAWVIEASGKQVIGGDKKAWVLSRLESIGIRGRVANFLVEMAYSWALKKGMIEA